MIVHAIPRIGIIRALNESAGRLFRAATQHRQNNSDNQSKKDGKDRETMQSSTTPDSGYHMVNNLVRRGAYGPTSRSNWALEV